MMAIHRLLTPITRRLSRSTVHKSVRPFRALPIHHACLVYPRFTPTQSRLYSQQNDKASKIYFFEDVKSLSLNPVKDRILIDTREPSELQATGTIPSSINIPVTSQPDAFFITNEEFEDRFGFERPTKDQEVIFYCKAGVRSRAAATLAKQAGWENVSEYPESWLGWVNHGGHSVGGQ